MFIGKAAIYVAGAAHFPVKAYVIDGVYVLFCFYVWLWLGPDRASTTDESSPKCRTVNQARTSHICMCVGLTHVKACLR